MNDRTEVDVTALLRARVPLLWVVTREEARAELTLAKAAARANYVPHFWDCAQGPKELDGRQTPGAENLRDINELLDRIGDRAKNGTTREVWILRDLSAWLEASLGIVTRRVLRNLARTLPASDRIRAQAIIVVTTDPRVPEDLAGHVTVIEWPLPDRAEIAQVLDAAIEGLPDEARVNATSDGIRDLAIDAAVGLTAEEAANCYARSLVQTRRIDPVIVAGEKKRVIARERVLEWFDPLPGGLESVGGLDILKSWLVQRASAYTPEAKVYGLPPPKGALLAGVPGCGKSLTCKAIATTWQRPLLRMDLGAVKSKFVGESESNLRRAFKVIESVGRCVVWLDEIEKALAGATQGAADGGVSADALGAILNWMQERQGEAFVVATCNDVTSLPPELLRKGRFDEIFFVDLPTLQERTQILKASLRQYPQTPIATMDFDAISRTCQDFTGSEIAAIVPDAMFTAFADGRRPLRGDDLIEAARRVVPLAKTGAEKIAALRDWAKGRARRASPEDQQQTTRLRTVDIS